MQKVLVLGAGLVSKPLVHYLLGIKKGVAFILFLGIL